MNDHPQQPVSYGLGRQMQVYMQGLQGQRPTLPVSPEQLEQQAKAQMSQEARGYLAGMDDTMRSNRTAFEHWSIVPRMLRDVSHRQLTTALPGMQLPVPLLLAPIGVQSIIHPDGELAVARAAAALGVPMILSTAASCNIETVGKALGETPRWFQLYWSKDLDLNASFVQRAEKAGYSAIVVTLDTLMLSWREQDIQNAYLPFLLGEGLANYFTDPIFRQSLPQAPEDNPMAAIRHFIDIFLNPALTWDQLGFLRQHTNLPIFLKGVMHPDDAQRTIDIGMDGIVVSNHGGRQVGGARGALDALPGISAAVQRQIPVLFDSGIRRGSDIIKALALGASAVLLGRPYIWGLALDGQQGVQTVLENLLADLDLTLALSGYSSLDQLDASALVHE
ncbi:alpha-hydroxy-acid oxidizing protein [Dictyobacter arantiisoli]|uniref:L-lactate 2-monooxygenase n=1 Tax=Dictyobacter arantiisoli TaxID=2014874 RepID=A0A5A5TB17_9CHLR|nr:alpha-hydroxy-acid oxidizing protein [Dictyobacter arantiisoli]GCF08189.1 L-lactate 2-monooxygenase [Dictyobacter arantiisoli]